MLGLRLLLSLCSTGNDPEMSLSAKVPTRNWRHPQSRTTQRVVITQWGGVGDTTRLSLAIQGLCLISPKVWGDQVVPETKVENSVAELFCLERVSTSTEEHSQPSVIAGKKLRKEVPRPHLPPSFDLWMRSSMAEPTAKPEDMTVHSCGPYRPTSFPATVIMPTQQKHGSVESGSGEAKGREPTTGQTHNQ